MDCGERVHRCTFSYKLDMPIKVRAYDNVVVVVGGGGVVVVVVVVEGNFDCIRLL